MKSVETVRDGGIIAFITSQGILNSEQNRPVRQWLAQRCDVVSAIRLPNNLFRETAGTEVGSDLIVLQKRPPGEYALNRRQEDFIESRKLSNGITVNNLFQQFDRVVHTDAKVGTDPYGKPAMEFTHSGGIENIALDMQMMLAEDFSKHLDLNRYQSFAPQIAEQSPERNLTESEIEAVRNARAEGFNLDIETGELSPIATMEQIHEVTTTENGEYKPTAEDWADYGLWAAEQEQRQMEEQPPQPEDYEITDPTEEPEQQTTMEPAPTAAAGDFRGTLFDMDDPSILTKLKETVEPKLNVQQEPLITLYDLFGFSQEERSQINRPRRRRKKPRLKRNRKKTVPLIGGKKS